MGILGVLLATVISKALLIIWYDPYIIHKIEFKKTPKRFDLRYLYYALILVITFLITYEAITYISISGILGFLVCGIIITLIVAFIFLLSTYKLNLQILEIFKYKKLIIKHYIN